MCVCAYIYTLRYVCVCVQNSNSDICACVHVCVCDVCTAQWFRYMCVCAYIYIHSDVCVCTYIRSFQILFPGRLLQDNEWSSLCYTVGPWCLSTLFVVLYICQSKLPNLYLLHFPFGKHEFVFYVWVYFFFANKLISIIC